MDEMIGNAEEFYQSLGIPYRVVNIVSGEEASYCVVNIILSKEESGRYGIAVVVKGEGGHPPAMQMLLFFRPGVALPANPCAIYHILCSLRTRKRHCS